MKAEDGEGLAVQKVADTRVRTPDSQKAHVGLSQREDPCCQWSRRARGVQSNEFVFRHIYTRRHYAGIEYRHARNYRSRQNE